MIRFITALLLLMMSFTVAQSAITAEYRLRWEVVQPFRFLRSESDHIIHEWAWNSLTEEQKIDTPVSSMEAHLNDPVWWNDDSDEDPNKTRVELLHDMRAQDPAIWESHRNVTLDLDMGWASFPGQGPDNTTNSVAHATCWHPSTQTFRFCKSSASDIRGGNQYIKPDSHFAKAWFEISKNGDDWFPVEGNCRFTTDTEAFVASAGATSAETKLFETDCETELLMRVRYRFDSEKDASPIGIALEARFTDDTPDSDPIAKTKIAIRDILVASMGDSFASGEGNPDVPAKIDPSKYVTPSSSNNKAYFGKALPVRNGKEGPAFWLDRRCHRSMYAAPTRAAIALALQGERHHAITFVSTACSGAEIVEGLLWPQDGAECTDRLKTMGHRLYQPQVGALVDALGNNFKNVQKLTPFPLLKRAGGSTAKLSSDPDVVALTNKGRRPSFCKGWAHDQTIDVHPMLTTAAFDQNRKIDILFLSITGNDIRFAGVVADRILNSGGSKFWDELRRRGVRSVTPENGIENIEEIYLGNRFEILDLAIEKKLELLNKEEKNRVIISAYPDPSYEKKNVLCKQGAKHGMDVSRYMGLDDVSNIPNLVDKLNKKIADKAAAYGWNFVNGYIEGFKDHGICAGFSDDVQSADYHGLTIKEIGAENWNRDGIKPYAKRQRFFRTPNDAFEIVQLSRKNVVLNPDKSSGKTSAINLSLATMGGSFHPTAEGLALVADHLFCAAAEKLEIDGKLENVKCALGSE